AAVQETVYMTVEAEERGAAHGAAARWYAARPGADPSLIAWHFERAHEQARASRWYEAAARAAVQGRDLDRALHLADAAIAGGTSGETLAAIMSLRAEIAFHRGDASEGKRAAEVAMREARPGSAIWMSAAGVLVTSAGQRGDNDDIARLAEVVRAQSA